MNISYEYLLPQKGIRCKQMHEKSFVMKDNAIWETYPHGVILPVKQVTGDSLQFGRGGVNDKNGNYVALSGLPGRCEKTYSYDKKEYKEGKAVYCGYFFKQWGHFLLEDVARLWYCLEEEATDVDYWVFTTRSGEHDEITGNYKEFLELLGIWEKVILINTPTEFHEVIVPELGYKCQKEYTQQYLRIFDKVSERIYDIGKLQTFTKVYFTRSGLQKNNYNEFGHQMLDHFFEKNGFKILRPEQLSLKEMIWYIRHAEICACPSGTPPHNMLFATNKQSLVICEKCPVVNEFQVDIDRMRDLEVVYIDSNISIFPVDVGAGPFIMCYNDIFESFADDYHYQRIEKIQKKPRDLSHILNAYLHCYGKTNYSYPAEWIVKGYYEEIKEAYNLYIELYGDILPQGRLGRLKNSVINKVRSTVSTVRNRNHA